MASYSLRQYAAHRRAAALPGGTLAAVQKALRAGRITATRGRIDPEQADRDWAVNTDPSYQRLVVDLEGVPAAGDSGFDRARAALLAALAERQAGGGSAEAIRGAAVDLARAVLNEMRPGYPAGGQV
jgi:hypothetical protein